MMLLESLGHPLLSTSLPGEMIEEYTDPELINDRCGNLVDAVIDGGTGGFVPSTIVDCTTDDWTVTREGLGQWRA